MSEVHFQQVAGVIHEATASYQATDYTLRVAAPERLPMHRISIDTLTLLFEPENHVLLGFDAYTNFEKWNRRHLVVPRIDQEMAIICTELFDEHGIGPGSSSSVQYSYSEQTALLFIELGAAQVVNRIRCLSCAVCGLGPKGELIEIWVEGLRFDQDENSEFIKGNEPQRL